MGIIDMRDRMTRRDRSRNVSEVCGMLLRMLAVEIGRCVLIGNKVTTSTVVAGATRRWARNWSGMDVCKATPRSLRLLLIRRCATAIVVIQVSRARQSKSLGS